MRHARTGFTQAGFTQAGFTLVELILAMGLFSLLLVGLLQLLDTTAELWRDVEVDRERTEIGTALVMRLEHDLSTLEAGIEGDLWADWATIDADGDELAGLSVPRLRFVRRASAREVARLAAELDLAAADEADEDADGDAETSLLTEPAGDLSDPSLEGWKRVDRGLCEVVWALVPADEQPFRGRLIRAVRLLDDDSKMSLFDERLFTASGRPVPGLFEPLSDDVLWMDMAFAGQVTQTRAEARWDIGPRPVDGARSWDGWDRQRLSLERSELNVGPEALPQPDETPNLPRRVRVRFEVETPQDRLRRPTLLNGIEHDATVFDVSDGSRMPDVGRHVLVGEEWLEVRAVNGDRVNVLRGQRGTLTQAHDAGTPLFFGWVVEAEVPIGVAREDWGL